jgi:NADH:ubiquinone oxidoreductase subunit C
MQKYLFHEQNRIEHVLNYSIIFEKNKFFFYTTSFFKNHLILWTNVPQNQFFLNFINKNKFFSLTDLIGYDKSSVSFFLNFKNTPVLYLFFNYMTDSYFLISFNKLNSLKNLFFSSYWLERELKEMFGVLFLNSVDTRNIFLEYSTTTRVLLKQTPLETFRDLKIRSGKIILENSQTVEL